MKDSDDFDHVIIEDLEKDLMARLLHHSPRCLGVFATMIEMVAEDTRAERSDSVIRGVFLQLKEGSFDQMEIALPSGIAEIVESVGRD